MERGPRHKDENRKSKHQGRGEWQEPEAGRDRPADTAGVPDGLHVGYFGLEELEEWRALLVGCFLGLCTC